MRGRAVVTNTAPTSAYRSAGRPEVVFVLERMIDIACRRHGFDRLEIRRRNLVPPKAMPYRNPLGLVYDSGDYPADYAAAWAQDNEARAARTFAMAIKLREALFGIFSAIGAAEPCDRINFLIFGAALARAPQRCRLVSMQCRFAWSIARTRNPASDALTPVLWSAADLMLGAASHRIRRCANKECLWLFLDQSKTNTRHWCDMGSCGNLAKSRRHYARAASSRRNVGNPG